MMEKNSLAAKVINIDGVPRRGILRKHGADGMCNVKDVNKEPSSKSDKQGIEGDAAMLMTDGIEAGLSKGSSNEMVKKLNDSGDVDDVGKRSYADQLLENGKSSSNADKSMGTSSIDTAMRDFKECMDDIEMMDINRTGLHFTWNQKPRKGVGICNKIDCIMGNIEFMSEFSTATAIFQPYRISDHTPCVLKLPCINRKKPQPFKFPNFLLFKPGFYEMVKSHWVHQIEGVHQFKVVKKLRMLKHPIRTFFQVQGNLHNNVKMWRNRLDAIQRAIDLDPTNAHLCEESRCLMQFNQASLDEERFLKQKAKIHWLAVGDANNSFFHNSLKCKNHGN
ncbi:hypothetical protein QVD17_39579 [Tagetes erecta]|uniref:RNA-directed DNA polymerase, eukaryota, Reverse transcriptase zinc-binding domain protein n=1 Tax=Tagetes erecta TaxID=13708 RepID=A0AAD8JSN8_TARER|nr:hypothetical protein QVD17_39579 [Tagetes erecta]